MLKESAKIFGIILNWNGGNDTLECLESVQKIDYPNFDILVVDNGSTDNSVEVIRHRFPLVKIIENKDNLGYADGNNVGIRYCLSQGADFIFILNNDTIVDSNILKAFVLASSLYSQAGIFGAKIYYYNEPTRIWYAGAEWIPNFANFIHTGINKIDDNLTWENVKEVEFAIGCAFFIRAVIFDKVGFFDSRFFLRWEEIDLCRRAHKAGYKTLFIPQAKVWHKTAASFSGGLGGPHTEYYDSRNRLLYIEKNISFPEKCRLLYPLLRKYLHDFLRLFSNKYSNNDKFVMIARLYGLRDYLFRKFGANYSFQEK